jgi:predicted phosphodiesterase
MLEEFVRYVNENLKHVQLVLVGGDLGFGGATLKRFKRVFSGLKVRWRTVIGDNDSYGSYQRLFGPLRYEFTHRRVRFLLFDSAQRSGSSGPLQFGEVTDETLRWLNDRLRARQDEMVVLVTHVPMVPQVARNSGQVLEVIRSAGKVKLVLAGHIHFETVMKKDGMVHYCGYGFYLKPHQFAEFLVTDKGLWLRRHYFDGRRFVSLPAELLVRI